MRSIIVVNSFLDATIEEDLTMSKDKESRTDAENLLRRVAHKQNGARTTDDVTHLFGNFATKVSIRTIEYFIQNKKVAWLTSCQRKAEACLHASAVVFKGDIKKMPNL